ncbi:MAG: rhodanese-like domain-containing protein [Immundisolibacterales bacterium]|nr:rhodanese-like domain-containing protein [Immundisolibacterales bacterium]
MEQFAAFVLDHAVLTFLFLGLLGALVWTSIPAVGGGQVSPADAVRLMSHEDAVVIDLRPDAEFRNGHIVNAVHVPIDQIEGRLGRLGKYRQKPVIAACRTGQQSANAVKRLRTEGFERVHRLQGGMMAWQSAELPITKD